ncbi:plasmid stabilization system protein [mine drainage metagenome]|uniref:Plasmid stabilization system protein n=1 Tax=mine drainage metagenome TaxID=410659 RepID=T1C4Q9_9ZZZZ
MSYVVVFSPEALEHLDAIERYIAESGSPVNAVRFVDTIVAFCESLTTFPQRGTQRDDLFPGLRITNFRGGAVITFVVNKVAETVAIVGVFYGGQDYEAVLQEP